jgi:LAS superfamily LD-carboxypeptidase LdcB
MKYFPLLLLLFIPYSCTQLGKAQPDKVIPVEYHLTDTTPSATLDSLSVEMPAPKPEQLEFSIEYLMGKFEPAKHPDFVLVDKKYADDEGYYLRKDTYESFKKMWEAARADSITLTIVSATRNFSRQKSIWEAKWTGARKIENGTNAALKYPDPKTRALKILEYSSMPGTSRHHWGTDMDLNDLDNYTFEQGQGKKVYDWLQKNASKYGFCQPYTVKGKNRPNGYNEEKWHWSYIPISKQLTELAARRLQDEMIGGFEGAQTALSIGIVKKYVLGVNKNCL